MKKFFPVLGKDEKEYLSKMEKAVESFCEENPTASIEELCAEFGNPSDTMFQYCGIMGPNKLASLLTIRKNRHRLMFFIGAIAIAFLFFCASLFYQEHKMIQREEAVFTTTYISDPEST